MEARRRRDQIVYISNCSSIFRWVFNGFYLVGFISYYNQLPFPYSIVCIRSLPSLLPACGQERMAWLQSMSEIRKHHLLLNLFEKATNDFVIIRLLCSHIPKAWKVDGSLCLFLSMTSASAPNEFIWALNEMFMARPKTIFDRKGCHFIFLKLHII